MDRKEAIEIVRDNWPEGRVLLKSALEVLIPELRESEDKRIRERLIKGMKYLSEESSFFRDIPKDKVIAWLEKQGKIAEHYEDKLDRCTCDSFDKGYRAAIENLDKQKPGSGEGGDKTETKFKAGDWVVKGDVVAQILYEQKYAFVGLDTKGNYFVCNYGHVDSIRPWTIQDAKDGDVLVAKIDKEPNDFVYLFKGYDQGGFYSRFYLDGYLNEFHEGIYHNNHNVGVPATKEQCDLLFKKMKEAGYEWDVKKKELKRVEPKFKVDDWVVYNKNIYQIHNISLKKYYECLRIDGTVHTFDFEYIDSKSHLWTINDAKDGDVLATHLSPEGDWIGIYKESVDILGFKTYCFLNGVGEFVINPNRCRNHGTHGLHPATKEQCNLLFTKMKEAGYEWDSKKKELKKIEQKVAWSEEDEKMFECALDMIEWYSGKNEDKSRLVSGWLKFIKERMKGE